MATDWAAEYFDPAASEKHDVQRLLYLSRHARIEPPYFEAMTDREVDLWVSELSEAIQREMRPRK